MSCRTLKRVTTADQLRPTDSVFMNDGVTRLLDVISYRRTDGKVLIICVADVDDDEALFALDAPVRVLVDQTPRFIKAVAAYTGADAELISILSASYDKDATRYVVRVEFGGEPPECNVSLITWDPISEELR